MKAESLQPNIDLKSTQPFLTPDGNHLVMQGFIFRKISKFLAGTEEDGVIPVPCFYDIKTGNILTETLPKELREEYEKYQEEDFQINTPG